MKLLRDTWILFVHNILRTLRSPVWVIIGLFQPFCYLLLFAPLLQSVSHAPGFPPGGAMTVFTPGVLVMMGLFNTVFNGFELIIELKSGVIERLRVTPVSRGALLLNRVLRDVCTLLIQSVLVMAVAFPLGARATLPGLILSFVLLVFLAICLSSCAYALALTLKDVNALSSSLNTLTLPIFLLSGITLPLTLAPPILRVIALFNPLAYAVNAARLLFNGTLIDGTVLEGFAITLVLMLLALLWGYRSFQNAVA